MTERESVYEDCGGLHAVKTDVFEKTRSLMGDKTTHVLLDKISSKKVDSIVDLEIAEFLYQKNINNA